MASNAGRGVQRWCARSIALVVACVSIVACASPAGERRAATAPAALPWPTLQAGGATAAFGADGARVTIAGRVLTLRAVSIGRGDVRNELRGDVEARAEGGEVRTERSPGVVEWWRSLPTGLEHGITIAERPAGEGDLELVIALGGALRARSLAPDSVGLVDSEGTPVATYAELVVLDATGTRVPATMVADGGITIRVSDVDARYPLVIDPLLAHVQEGALIASDGEAGDRFGASVALSADGALALVGVSEDDTVAGTNVGSVRFFTRVGTVWTEGATLVAFDGATNDRFGYSVALSADGALALVGVRGDDTAGGTNAGTARVFSRVGTTWVEEATLAAFDGAQDDVFGGAVALSADGTYALIGATGDVTSGGFQTGSARVFLRSGTTWVEQATLLVSGGGDDDTLGCSVSLAADGSRALVGNFGDRTPMLQGGSARVFVRSGTTWTEEASLLPFDPDGGDYFGYSVALSADGSRAIVGVPYDDTAAVFHTGSARMFARVGATWTEEAMLLPADAAANDQFGWTVAISSDGSRAFVGSIDDSLSPRSGVGSVRVFLRSGTTWTEAGTMLAPDRANFDRMGGALAVSTDGMRVLAGAESDDTTGGADAGSARVFTLRDADPLGSACTSDASCLSGFCVDGVCCDTACGAGAADCQACTAVLSGGTTGTCTVYGAGATCRGAASACDAAEVCDGASTACPVDARASAGTVCRPQAGPCDVAETCTGGSFTCPADILRSASTTCRASAGICDVAEMCTGTAAACPPDGFLAPSSTCRPSAGICDVAETCSGSSAACPADAFLASSTVCRAQNGSCDVAELCTGAGAACPPDALSTAVCRVAAGGCDLPEVCDGVSRACPADTLAAPAAVCRPAAGPCDRDETCTGLSPTCPVDLLQPTSTVCRLERGPCDVPELCDGASVGCPPDALATPGALCRPSAGGCDTEDRCTGTTVECPIDAFSPPGTTCRAAVGTCDVAEACDGASAACPADVVLAAATSCRASLGSCDPAEACDGTSGACPADLRQPAGTRCGGEMGSCATVGTCDGIAASCTGGTPLAAGTVCLPAAPSSPCDADDVCDGVSDVCPPTFRPAGHVCGAATAEACDAPDECTGTSADCVPTFLSGVECRASRGACDPPEFCSGSTAACPPDATHPAATVCRASTDPSCDTAESCDGTAASCPADVTACAPIDGGTDHPDASGPPADDGAPVAATGCSCRASSAPPPLGALFALLALCAWRTACRMRRPPVGRRDGVWGNRTAR